MKHYLYCSAGNTLGIDEYIGLFEFGEDGFCVRYLEVQASGNSLRYSEKHAADQHGVLPERRWNEHEEDLSKAAYGLLSLISPALFEAAWKNTRCLNETIHN
jgi:hypothetical protein